MTLAFTTARRDGRTDARLISDLLDDFPPESIITYSTLHAALDEGLDAPVKRARVYAAIYAANKIMLREKQRYLKVVRKKGYRLLRGFEHLGEAKSREQRANNQIVRGVEILKHVKYDEMTPEQRKAHEGQMLLTSGLASYIEYLHAVDVRRKRAIEQIRRPLADLQETLAELDKPRRTGVEL